MGVILSILTASIPERSNILTDLVFDIDGQINRLHNEHPSLGRVEYLIDKSNTFLNGGLSIGKKRERLAKDAIGKYLCFLDDDEDIAPNYVETLVRLCQHDTDVVTFRNLTKTDHYWTIVDMSLHYHKDDEANPRHVTRRRPWHICPIRSALAKMYKFDDTNYGEDASWMDKVLKNCVTEIHTDMVLHCYNHSSKTSEADKITQHALSKS